MLKKFALPLILVIALACSACIAAPGSPGATEAARPTTAPPETELSPGETPTRPEKTLPAGAIPVETVEVTPVLGEVPDELLGAIIADLAGQLAIDPGAIDVIQAEAVVWNDGSLGCPQPGNFYTQALVPGYTVVLQVDSQAYDYHAGESGHYILCEPARP